MSPGDGEWPIARPAGTSLIAVRLIAEPGLWAAGGPRQSVELPIIWKP